MKKITAKFDQAYVDARNKLIPIAEKYANQMCGTSRYGTGSKQDEYRMGWTRCFLEKMDSLAKNLKY